MHYNIFKKDYLIILIYDIEINTSFSISKSLLYINHLVTQINCILYHTYILC